MPAAEFVDDFVERRARQLSRNIGITYYHALAVVLANAVIKAASHE